MSTTSNKDKRQTSRASAPDRLVPTHSSHTERIATAVTQLAGTAKAHWFALLLVIIWLAIGPLGVDRPGGHELLEQIIGGLSFLMLFILQRSQNKDTLALQLKLDELVASNPKASNRVLNAEDISEDELARLRRHFAVLDRLSREDEDLELTEADARRRHAAEREHARARRTCASDDE